MVEGKMEDGRSTNRQVRVMVTCCRISFHLIPRSDARTTEHVARFSADQATFVLFLLRPSVPLFTLHPHTTLPHLLCC